MQGCVGTGIVVCYSEGPLGLTLRLTLLTLTLNRTLTATTTTFFQDNLGKPAPQRLTILEFTAARDDRVAVASAGPYANHLHLVPDR